MFIELNLAKFVSTETDQTQIRKALNVMHGEILVFDLFDFLSSGKLYHARNLDFGLFLG